MRRIASAFGLGVTLAASGCLGGGGGEGKQLRGSAKNRAPQINGNAKPEAPSDQFYDFRPSTSDPDGDKLVFSISNKPPWAKFDRKAGRLTGTPADRDIGIYTGITIVVSDKRASTALPEFEIAVIKSASGVVTLSWTPPTQNEDGSALQDLAGYRIYAGTDPDSLSRVIVLGNPGLTRYVVENLTPATWHFAMTSFNRDGQESRRSATVSKPIV
jgi:hypothetical protein